MLAATLCKCTGNNVFCQVYLSPNHPSSLLIMYTGDETVAGQFPHGNAKYAAACLYIRTRPRVLRGYCTRSRQRAAQHSAYIRTWLQLQCFYCIFLFCVYYFYLCVFVSLYFVAVCLFSWLYISSR